MMYWRFQPRSLSAWAIHCDGTTPKARNRTPKAYTAPIIASPHETGVPRGRRLPYGMTATVSKGAAIRDTRNAVLAPGITQPWPNQLKAIIALVVTFRVRSRWCGHSCRLVAGSGTVATSPALACSALAQHSD